MKHFLFTVAGIILCLNFAMAQNKQLSGDYQIVGKYGEYGVPWALIKKDSLYGFVDRNGNMVVPPKYSSIEKFGAHGVSWALVEKDGKLGFIDKQGNEVVKPQYEMIDHFGTYGPPWALVRKDGRLGFIDQNGKEDFSIASTMSYQNGRKISLQPNLADSEKADLIDRILKEIVRLQTQSPSKSDDNNGLFALILHDRNLTRDLVNKQFSSEPTRTSKNGNVKQYSAWNLVWIDGKLQCKYQNNENDSDMIVPVVKTTATVQQ